MQTKTCLVEIHTEELPPKSLQLLGQQFLKEIETRLQKLQASFTSAKAFMTPRRLAVVIEGLTITLPPVEIEKRGPAIKAAFDSNGQPTPACVGFAKSCGITPDKLITLKTPQGEWVGYKETQPGKNIAEALPALIEGALNALPIPKRMRWGDNTIEFVRPISAITLMLDDIVLPAIIMGMQTSNTTFGHRVHAKQALQISHAKDYEALLEKSGSVIADFEKRKDLILNQCKAVIEKLNNPNLHILFNDALLNEVTGLVEWPVAFIGKFDPAFLTVPQEALIFAMQDHQRYFPIVDAQNKLQPYFVGVSNIAAKDMQTIIAGNERVLKARLSDAAFFFQLDQKTSLQQQLDLLKNRVFQAQLGSVFDKAKRISALSQYIAKTIHVDADQAQRAGLLAKADLNTHLVNEFPELQGIAGYYYALLEGEPKSVALALREHYLPKFAGDVLPTEALSLTVAIADRIDTLVGIFGVGLHPTGDKDPFGLRRASVGVLRILIEKAKPGDLTELIAQSIKQFTCDLKNKNVAADVLHFMMERLKHYYLEQGVALDVINAVCHSNNTHIYDLHRRIQAVTQFKALSAAQSLSVANKRVANLLAKATQASQANIDAKLFEAPAEKNLFAEMNKHDGTLQKLMAAQDYENALLTLSQLREVVDQFFDDVMVMTDDIPRRDNRLNLLAKLRESFLQVADVALLVGDKEA